MEKKKDKCAYCGKVFGLFSKKYTVTINGYNKISTHFVCGNCCDKYGIEKK